MNTMIQRILCVIVVIASSFLFGVTAFAQQQNNTSQSSVARHPVADRETVSAICKKYSITWSQLYAANEGQIVFARGRDANGRRVPLLRIGQELIIPASAPTAPTSQAPVIPTRLTDSGAGAFAPSDRPTNADLNARDATIAGLRTGNAQKDQQIADLKARLNSFEMLSRTKDDFGLQLAIQKRNEKLLLFIVLLLALVLPLIAVVSFRVAGKLQRDFFFFSRDLVSCQKEEKREQLWRDAADYLFRQKYDDAPLTDRMDLERGKIVSLSGILAVYQPNARDGVLAPALICVNKLPAAALVATELDENNDITNKRVEFFALQSGCFVEDGRGFLTFYQRLIARLLGLYQFSCIDSVESKTKHTGIDPATVATERFVESNRDQNSRGFNGNQATTFLIPRAAETICENKGEANEATPMILDLSQSTVPNQGAVTVPNLPAPPPAPRPEIPKRIEGASTKKISGVPTNGTSAKPIVEVHHTIQ